MNHLQLFRRSFSELQTRELESESSRNNSGAETSQSASFCLRLPLRRVGIMLGLSLQVKGSHPQHINPWKGSSVNDLAKTLPTLHSYCHPCFGDVQLHLTHAQTLAYPTQTANQAVPEQLHIPSIQMPQFLQVMEWNYFQTSLLSILFPKPQQSTAGSRAELTTSLQWLSANFPPVTPHLAAITQAFTPH